MPRLPKFAPVETPDGWRVNVPPALSALNRRERHYFAGFKEADRFAGKLRAQWTKGTRNQLFTPRDAIDAQKALKVLEPFGISLEDAAKFYAETKGKETREGTFREAWLEFRAKNEGDWSGRYRQDMEAIERWLPEDFMERELRLVSAETVEAELRRQGLADSTIKQRLATIRPVITGKTRKKRREDIEVMSPKQVGKMLRACKTPSERWVVALLCFAGIRPQGEMERLDWSHVKGDTIEFPGGKGNVHRFIPMTPRLKRLLRDRPKVGNVRCPNYKRTKTRLYKAAGCKQDAPRRTFASNFAEAYGIDAAREAMGHTRSAETIFRHYKRAVEPGAGRRYFGERGR